MASEGDKIFVGKIVVGTDPVGELTKDDWAVVVGKGFHLLWEKKFRVIILLKIKFIENPWILWKTFKKDSHGIIKASGNKDEIVSRFDGEIIKEAVLSLTSSKNLTLAP